MFILKLIDNLGFKLKIFLKRFPTTEFLVVPTNLLLKFSILSRPDLIGHSLSPPPKRAFFCLFFERVSVFLQKISKL